MGRAPGEFSRAQRGDLGCDLFVKNVQCGDLARSILCLGPELFASSLEPTVMGLLAHVVVLGHDVPGQAATLGDGREERFSFIDVSSAELDAGEGGGGQELVEVACQADEVVDGRVNVCEESKQRALELELGLVRGVRLRFHEPTLRLVNTMLT